MAEAKPSRPNIGCRRSANISFRQLVDFAKLRWRIEADYQELKQEVGLGHYEGADGAASIITPRCASQPRLPDLREEMIPPQDSFTRSHKPVLPDGYDQGILPCGLNATFRIRSQHARR